MEFGGAAEFFEQFEEQDGAAEAADLEQAFDDADGVFAGASSDLESTFCAMEELLQGLHGCAVLPVGAEQRGKELDDVGIDGVTGAGGCGVAIVVRDIWAEEHEVAWQEWGEFITDPALGAALGYEGDFAFGVVMPDTAEVFALHVLAGDEFGGGEGGWAFDDEVHLGEKSLVNGTVADSVREDEA